MQIILLVIGILQFASTSLATNECSECAQDRTAIAKLFGQFITGDKFEFAVEHFKNFNAIILKEIIEETYNGNNLELILSFIDKVIDKNSTKYVNGLTYLFEEIKKRNIYGPDIFRLAYAVKQTYSKLSDCESCGRTLNNLKELLPSYAVKMIWSLPVCIISNYVNEYMYVSDNLFNNEARYVYTSNLNKALPVKGIFWQFEPIENGNLFNIKNIGYNEYLYPLPLEHKYNDERRRVMTGINGTALRDAQWKITLNDEKSFSGQSIEYGNEFFYPLYFGKSYEPGNTERIVLTWIPGGCEPEEQCAWSLTDCDGKN